MSDCVYPCPCGYYGDSLKPCTCAPEMVTKYQKRISDPLLDRIDIHIEVPRVDYEKLSGDRMGETWELIRVRVRPVENLNAHFISFHRNISTRSHNLTSLPEHMHNILAQVWYGSCLPVKISSLMVGCVAIEGLRHLGSAANNFTEDMLFLLPSNSLTDVTEKVNRS